jgi:hypothetical protein
MQDSVHSPPFGTLEHSPEIAMRSPAFFARYICAASWLYGRSMLHPYDTN